MVIDRVKGNCHVAVTVGDERRVPSDEDGIGEGDCHVAVTPME